MKRETKDVAKSSYQGLKVREGTVVSDKMDKGVVVAVEGFQQHRVYKKVIRHLVRYKAHDEKNTTRNGDRVRIIESRPLSGGKRWRVVEVLERSQLPEVKPDTIDLELLGEVNQEADEKIQEPEESNNAPSATPSKETTEASELDTVAEVGENIGAETDKQKEDNDADEGEKEEK